MQQSHKLQQMHFSEETNATKSQIATSNSLISAPTRNNCRSIFTTDAEKVHILKVEIVLT